MSNESKNSVKFTGVKFRPAEETFFTEQGEIVCIETIVECESAIGLVLVASLEIDHHEVVPSFPITLHSGVNKIAGPTAKIANPRRYEEQRQCKYLLTLKFHNFADIVSFEDRISID